MVKTASSSLDRFNASEFLGRQFDFGARGEGNKYDCYGLAIAVYKSIGRDLPELISPGRRSEVHDSIIKGIPLFEELSDPEPFCLVTFWIKPRITTHVGIVMPDITRFIHVMIDANVCIEKLSVWKPRITGYYRYPGD